MPGNIMPPLHGLINFGSIAIQLEKCDSQAEYSDGVKILRFGAPVSFGEEAGIAHITAKGSVQHGDRIYSMELTEIKKLRNKGDTAQGKKPEVNTTSEAAERLSQLAENVKPEARFSNMKKGKLVYKTTALRESLNSLPNQLAPEGNKNTPNVPKSQEAKVSVAPRPPCDE